MSDTGHAITPDGIALEWVARSGEVPRFLLVHGLASNLKLWDGVAAGLSERGFASLAVDLRGHGGSDKPNSGYDFATMSDDLAAVVDATGGGPVVAVGQSYGGNLVIEMTRRHPHLVEAVACIDGGFIALSAEMPEFSAVESRLAPPRLDGVSAADVRARVSERMSTWPSAAVEATMGNLEEMADGTIRARLARAHHLTILRHMWEHDPRQAVSELDVPVLVVACGDATGAKSARVEEFAAAARKPDVRWVDADHDVHAQFPEMVADLLAPLGRRR